MPELIAIKLSSIHESLRLLCLSTLAKLHICETSWQVHSFVHSQLDMFHCAVSRENLMNMLLLHIPCEVAHMKPAGLSFRCLVLLTNRLQKLSSQEMFEIWARLSMTTDGRAIAALP